MDTLSTYPEPSGFFKELHYAESPFELWGWQSGLDWQPGDKGTHFGAVSSGSLKIQCNSGEFVLTEGMVYCVPGRLRLTGDATAFGITARRYHGLFQVAGPVEQVGRLRYIDGCTDSLVLAPQVRGEPCLNHLHFPPRVRQTRHTHPSFRVGLVLRGRGICELADGEVPLARGAVFHLGPSVLHGFRTENEAMDVIAFHPDSDQGPWHDDHPMINRTIVDGLSANKIAKIRT